MAITTNGIAYDQLGDGSAALVMLPGWCGPRTLFGPVAAALAPAHRVLAVDWRGHGGSAPADREFGMAELVDDAVDVIESAGVTPVVPVGVAHAGWVAIELRKRLGPERVPGIAFVDWMVLGAPPPFIDALAAMGTPARTRAVVDQITAMWNAELDDPALSAYIASMAAFDDAMWARAARAIAGAFATSPVPLDELDALADPPRTIHLYAQPADPGYLDAQLAYASGHPWFGAERLEAHSHFPMLEVTAVVADRLGAFAAEVLGAGARPQEVDAH